MSPAADCPVKVWKMGVLRMFVQGELTLEVLEGGSVVAMGDGIVSDVEVPMCET